MSVEGPIYPQKYHNRELKQHEEKPSKPINMSKLETDASFDREGYRRALIKVDEQLLQRDIDGLKFLCKDIIPAAKLENIKRGLDLYTELEQKGLLDEDDIVLLAELLYRIQRNDLLKKIGTTRKKVIQQLGEGNSHLSPFRVLLQELIDDITTDEFKEMKFLAPADVPRNRLENIQDCRDFFNILEQHQILESEDVDILETLMKEIERNDLLKKVIAYKSPNTNHEDRKNPRPPPYNYIERLDEKILMSVAKDIGDEWMHLGIDLGLSKARLDQVRQEHHDSVSRTFLMLNKWRSREGRNATPVKLWDALKGVGLLSVAENHLVSVSASPVLPDFKSLNVNPEERQKPIIPSCPSEPPGHQESIQINYHFIIQNLMPDEVMDHLYSKQAVSSFEMERVQAARTQHEKIETLLSFLSRHSRRDYEVFIQALKDTNQVHIAEKLEEESTELVHRLEGKGEYPDKEHERHAKADPEEDPLENLPVHPSMSMEERYNHVYLPNRAVSEGPARVVDPQPRVESLGAERTTQQRPEVPMTARIEPQRLRDVMPRYKMTAKPRGHCIIINNKEFHTIQGHPDSKFMPRREGTDVDRDNLKRMFSQLDFHVESHDNVTSFDMKQILVKRAFHTDHKKFDCFVCCILTHGQLGRVYGSDGLLVEIKDLTYFFKATSCPSLAGKPKLFFIQACQGKFKQPGFIERDAPDDDETPETIPNEADFLLGYATVPGYVSYRSKSHGSWYITKLVESLERYADREDLLSIMIKVNEEVSKASAKLQGDIYKQSPAPLPTLRKKIYFN